MKKMLRGMLSLALMCALTWEVAAQRSQGGQPDTTRRGRFAEWSFGKFRFGGYGEILYQSMNYGPDRYKAPTGAPRDTRASIGVPRSILAFDYKFREDLVLSTEIEVEWGGTGAAMELEYEEAGEYEMEVEKGGEVALEQVHITKRFSDAFNIRAGHLIVPLGLTNAHHEPITFFGTVRPESETTILPSTWHETGLSVLGYLGHFRYELMVVSGLDPNGFSSANWVKGGKQGIFEGSTMTSPAYTGRVEYYGVKGLRLSASGYFCNSAKNASKPDKMAGIKAPVTIGSLDAQYLGRNLAVRANIIYGNLGASKRVSTINSGISKATGFSRTPVAKNALAYGVEAGYNVLSLFGIKEKLLPFVRYEYYNSAQAVEEGMAEMPINKRSVLTVGLNYFLAPNVALKADYAMRRFLKGSYNGENTLGVALVYTGWFINK